MQLRFRQAVESSKLLHHRGNHLEILATVRDPRFHATDLNADQIQACFGAELSSKAPFWCEPIIADPCMTKGRTADRHSGLDRRHAEERNHSRRSKAFRDAKSRR